MSASTTCSGGHGVEQEKGEYCHTLMHSGLARYDYRALAGRLLMRFSVRDPEPRWPISWEVDRWPYDRRKMEAVNPRAVAGTVVIDWMPINSSVTSKGSSAYTCKITYSSLVPQLQFTPLRCSPMKRIHRQKLSHQTAFAIEDS